MIVYWMMLWWTLLVGSLWIFWPRMIINQNNSYEKRANLFISIITFLPIIFFVGLRSGILDTGSYIYGFQNLPIGIDSLFIEFNGKDAGFYYFSVLFKTFISDDFHMWLFTISCISGLGIMIALYKHSMMFELSAFLFIATANFTWMLNGMRQFIVASILFASLELMINKRIYKLIILTLILSTIHYSVIIMIPVYFLVQRKYTKNIIPLLIFFTVFAIGSNIFIPILEPLLEETQYAGYTQDVFSYEGSSIMRLLIAGVPLVLIALKWNEFKKIDNQLVNVCTNMTILNVCTMIVSTAVGGILIGRLNIYFELYNLILYPLIIRKIYQKDEARMLYFLCILFYIIYFYYQMVITWNLYYISDILNLYLF